MIYHWWSDKICSDNMGEDFEGWGRGEFGDVQSEVKGLAHAIKVSPIDRNVAGPIRDSWAGCITTVR